MIVKQFENQAEQSDRIEEFWNIFNAVPDENLQYMGNSPGYVPVVRDAVKSRTKWRAKQLFPANHKHVDGIASDGKIPYTQLALLEHYIRTTRLKSIVRSDLIAGDVTGQWNLMIDWTKSTRSVTELVRRNPIVEKLKGENGEEEDVSDLDIRDPLAEEEEDTEEREVTEQGPEIIDFATEDLAVVPPTCNNLQKAKAVALRLRLSKEKIEEWVEAGVLILPADTEIDEFVKGAGSQKAKAKRDRAKKQSEDAGVKTDGTDKHALVFMAYAKLELDEKGVKESAIIYFGGPDEILGIIRNPLWSGRVPILSEPVERVQGSFFGKSQIEPVKWMQWQLVDFWNMGQDSAMYSLLPIFTADPLKTPNWQTLVMGLAAIWPIAPNDVGTIKVPQLWKESAGICDMIKRQIWESLGVNEMMMGRTPPGRKNNQMIGKMQQEQDTGISDDADRYEEVMLTPLVELLFEFDQQFRDAEVDIESRGELGVQAEVKNVPVQEWGERYFFRWMGTTYQATMARTQQQVAWVNVLKGIPPQMLGGKRLDLGPFLEMGTDNIFGPELAPRILVDERNMFTVPPDIEDNILHNGMHVQVHEADKDQEHMQSHIRAANLTGDPAGLFKAHMALHMQSMQVKRERAAAQQQPKGAPGTPGGGPPGAAGAPRPGAQPAPPRPGQQPPGAIQQDNMPGEPGRG